HTASLASPALRTGLDRTSAERSLRYLRTLLGAPAAALTDTENVLAWEGVAPEMADKAALLARRTVASGSTQVFGPKDVVDPNRFSEFGHAVAAPLSVEDVVVGTVLVVTDAPSAGLVRATTEV